MSLLAHASNFAEGSYRKNRNKLWCTISNDTGSGRVIHFGGSSAKGIAEVRLLIADFTFLLQKSYFILYMTHCPKGIPRPFSVLRLTTPVSRILSTSPVQQFPTAPPSAFIQHVFSCQYVFSICIFIDNRGVLWLAYNLGRINCYQGFILSRDLSGVDA